MNYTEEEELKHAEQFQAHAFKQIRELAAACSEPLTFEPIDRGGHPIKTKRNGKLKKTPDHYKIKSGIFWIPPFIEPEEGWPRPLKHAGKVKQTCKECGHTKWVKA